MSVREQWDVSTMLCGTVPRGNQGEFIDGLRDECGPIIGRVLEAVKQFTGRDLLKELLDPIAGDFQRISQMQHGWLVLSKACADVADNHRSLAAQLAPAWEGVAASACADRLSRSAVRHARQAEACELIADQLEHVIEVARETAHVVCAVLEFLDSIIQELATDAVLGPAGWAKAAVTAPGKAAKAARLIDRGVDAVEALRRAVQAAIRAVRDLQALLDLANTVVDWGEISGHTGAGTHLDETAGAGFR